MSVRFARLARSLPLVADQRSTASVASESGSGVGEGFISQGSLQDRGEPARVSRVGAAHRGEVACLDVEGYRIRRVADRAVVDRCDRRHLGSGAGQEYLVRKVELGS